MDFTGKTVVVTGSGKGLGMGIALEFGKAGANVVVTYHNSTSNVNSLIGKINSSGGQADKFKVDVSNEVNVKALMDFAVERFGSLDILVNNAAVQIDLPFEEYDPDDYTWLMDTNLKGYFMCTKYAAEKMIPNHKGKIIYISSIHSKRPTEFDPAYSMSKGGIRMLAREAAIEYGPEGIQVNVAEPGYVKIEAGKSGAAKNNYFSNIKKVPRIIRGIDYKKRMKYTRFCEPIDVGKLCIYLASSGADMLNGSAIRQDGGTILY